MSEPQTSPDALCDSHSYAQSSCVRSILTCFPVLQLILITYYCRTRIYLGGAPLAIYSPRNKLVEATALLLLMPPRSTPRAYLKKCSLLGKTQSGERSIAPAYSGDLGAYPGFSGVQGQSPWSEGQGAKFFHQENPCTKKGAGRDSCTPVGRVNDSLVGRPPTRPEGGQEPRCSPPESAHV